MTKIWHLQVDKYDGTGPVKVTLDLSGESASSDSPNSVDSNQPESTSDEDDAAKFLQVRTPLVKLLMFPPMIPRVQHQLLP